MRSRWVGGVLVIGAGVWLLVTVVAAIAVLQSPRENVGLAIGMALCWTGLIALAALTRFASRIGGE